MSDKEGEEAEADAAIAEGAAEQSAAPSADIAAVEGLLSGLALSEADTEQATAAALVAGAEGQPDQATAAATAPPACREAAALGLGGTVEVIPAPAAAADSAEAEPDLAATESAAAEGSAEAEPDLAAPAPAGDAQEKLVEEAEQQLAQLQLGAGRSAKVGEAPGSEEQQAAEGPQVAGSAAGAAASNAEGAEEAAGQEVAGQSKPSSRKRGSLTKKVPNPPSHLWSSSDLRQMTRVSQCLALSDCTALDGHDAVVEASTSSQYATMLSESTCLYRQYCHFGRL